MIINFETMDETVIPHFKGGEKELAAQMYVDELGKIMHGRLIPGATIGLHTHETNSEIIFILAGEGKTVYDDGEERVKPGMCHYCPKGHAHALINDGATDLEFYAVVPEQ